MVNYKSRRSGTFDLKDMTLDLKRYSNPKIILLYCPVATSYISYHSALTQANYVVPSNRKAFVITAFDSGTSATTFPTTQAHDVQVQTTVDTDSSTYLTFFQIINVGDNVLHPNLDIVGDNEVYAVATEFIGTDSSAATSQYLFILEVDA